MSHKNPLRTDKTCLNCRYVVQDRFCPNCGQENTDTRKTFYHLFVHFFEDLTHYENAFWKTIRNLLFKPSALTKEYLSGKRLSYLAPVRLYIFISFVTFFAFAIIPDSEEKSDGNFIKINETGKKAIEQEKNADYQRRVKKVDQMLQMGAINQKEADSIKKEIAIASNKMAKKSFMNFGYKSVEEIDSLYKYGKGEDEMSEIEYTLARKAQLVNENNTGDEIGHKFKESFIHNFPKVLFIYMPIFAVFLWLFHNKKRWYYFDHGIFTLHYFSFLLLIALLLFILNRLFSSVLGADNAKMIVQILYSCGFLWMFYYFFPAHHRFYGESRTVSFFKSIFLFFINSIFILAFLILFMIYTFINLE